MPSFRQVVTLGIVGGIVELLLARGLVKLVRRDQEQHHPSTLFFFLFILLLLSLPSHFCVCFDASGAGSQVLPRADRPRQEVGQFDRFRRAETSSKMLCQSDFERVSQIEFKIAGAAQHLY